MCCACDMFSSLHVQTSMSVRLTMLDVMTTVLTLMDLSIVAVIQLDLKLDQIRLHVLVRIKIQFTLRIDSCIHKYVCEVIC